MQILRPNQTFRILWVVADPNDATTYFPQITIKQTLNGVTLLSATNLVLDTTGRYYYDWIVPGDVNGGGTQIDVTVIVYTDSGHTTKSSVYTQENRVYNIFDLASLMRGGSGGGGLDESDIRKILAEFFKDFIIPNYEDHLAQLAGRMDKVYGSLGSIGGQLGSKNNQDVLDALSKLPKYGDALDKILSAATLITDALSGNQGQTLEGLQNLAAGIDSFKDKIGYISDWMNRTSQDLKEMPDSYASQAQELKSAIDDMKQNMRAVARVLASVQTMTVHTGVNLPGGEFLKEPEPKKNDYSKIVRKLMGV